MKQKFLSLIAILSMGMAAMAQCPTFTDLYSDQVTARYNSWEVISSAGGCWIEGVWYEHCSRVKENWNVGVVDGRHTLIDVQGTDPNTGGALSLIPDGESQVIRLGDSNVGRGAESLSYRFTVDEENSVLLLKFAIVLQDPGHRSVDQPRFEVRVTDPATGKLVESCAEYVVSARPDIPGFQSYQPKLVVWRDWTKVGIDLSKYAGKEVEVQFVNYDCWESAHFGYCYFTASCMSNRLSADCSDMVDGKLKFTAPADFESYLWSNGQTGQTATFVADDVKNSQITCLVTSAMGCTFEIHGAVTDMVITPETLDLDETICEGETYTHPIYNFINYTPTQAGPNFTQYVIVNAWDCIEKIINLKVTEIPDNYTRFKAAICEGQDYTENGFSYIQPAPGVYRDTLKTGTIGSCDLFNVLELVVSATFDGLPQIIEGDDFPCTETYATYSFEGTEILTNFYWEFPENVKVIKGNKNTPQVTLYFTNVKDVDGNILIHSATPGILKFHGENGCGSGTVEKEIKPRQTYSILKEETVCQGEEFNMYNFNLGVQNVPGAFAHTKDLESVSGCDSTVLLMLTVLPKPKARIEPQDTLLCTPGEEITLWAVVDDMEFIAPDLTDPSIVECDIETSYPSAFVGLAESAFLYDCEIEYEWAVASDPNTVIFDKGYLTVNPTQTTTYIVTVTQGGCPVTVSQTIMVRQSTPVVLNETMCEGETFSAYGITETESGTYTNNFAQGNCAVDVIVNLTVNKNKETIIDGGNICAGERYMGDGGKWSDIPLIQAGTFDFERHENTATGCDSLIILRLNVLPKKETIVRDTVCQYSPYTGYGFDLPVQKFATEPAKPYIYTDTLQTVHDCDSTVILLLTVTPVSKPDFGVTSISSNGTVNLRNHTLIYDENDVAGWEWYLDGAVTPFATTKNASITLTKRTNHITLKLISKSGCDAVKTNTLVIISANDDKGTTPPDTSIPIDILDNDDYDCVLTVTVIDPPANGTATPDNDNIIYTPDNDFEGIDVFEYEICCESTEICDQAKVYILVLEIDRITCEDEEIILFEGADHEWHLTDPNSEPEPLCKGVEINGVCWAKTNLDVGGKFAANDYDYGGYYQWGRQADGHESPTSARYPTDDDSSENGVVSGADLDAITGQVTTTSGAYGKFIKHYLYDWRTPQEDKLWNLGDEVTPSKNTAADPCPAGWRIPTQAELATLESANREWKTNYNGSGNNGYLITDNATSVSIFLPAAGCRYGDNGDVSGMDAYGYYWSSSPNSNYAYYLDFYNGNFLVYYYYRAYGFSIRCVAE